jgi:hypothetical protein
MSNPVSMRYLDMLIPQEPQAQDSWTWATVTSIGPLKIRLDGEAAELAGTPETLMKGLAVGDRVWVQLYGRRAIIHGGSSRTGAGSIFGGDTGWIYLDTPGAPQLKVARYMDMSGGWCPGRFRRDASGQVWMGGLFTSTANTLLFTLPKGFRPAYRVVIQTIGNVDQGLVEVLPNGNVTFLAGNGGYFALEPVQFMADGDDPLMQASWVPLQLANGWTLYDNSGLYGPAAYLVDSAGDVHFRSHIKGGTTGAAICATLPTSIRPVRDELWCIPASTGMVRVDINRAGSFTCSGYSPTGTNAWICLDTMILQAPKHNGLKPILPTLTNSWVSFDAAESSWSKLRMTVNKNNVVNLWGMVSSGSGSNNMVPANGIVPAFRPEHQEIFIASAATAGGLRVDVSGAADGSIVAGTYFQGGNNQWVGVRHRWIRTGY